MESQVDTLIDLEGAKKKVAEWEAENWDVTNSLKSIAISVEDESRIRVELQNGETKQGELSDHAKMQFLARLGIPGAYFNKCPKFLQKSQIEYWGEKEADRTLLWRGRGERIRGVLSDRFGDVPHEEILEEITRLELPVRMLKCDLTDYSMHMKLITEEPIMFPNDGDKRLYGGVSISNSDVGRRVFSLRFFLFKSFCSNGCIFGCSNETGVDLTHKGEVLDRAKSAVKQFSKRWLDGKDQVIHCVKEAEEDRFEDSKKDEVIKRLREFGLSKGFSMEVFDQASIVEGRNRWGLVNAITRLSQNLDEEKRYDIDSIAGSLLASSLN